LRREVELLKLNLEVMLEKVRAQEQELRELRGKKAAPQGGTGYQGLNRARRLQQDEPGDNEPLPLNALGRARGAKDKELDKNPRLVPDAVGQAEAALRALREANDDASRRRGLEALDRALRTLREQRPDGGSNIKKS
jgi:hypothetical protein